jgi:transposase
LDEGRRTAMQLVRIGLDVAKNVFQVHGVDGDGAVVLRRKLRRAEMLDFFGQLPPLSSALRLAAPRTIGHGSSLSLAMIRALCRRAMSRSYEEMDGDRYSGRVRLPNLFSGGDRGAFR